MIYYASLLLQQILTVVQSLQVLSFMWLRTVWDKVMVAGCALLPLSNAMDKPNLEYE
jgi:hypothetical protein